jgi:RNA polymerase sigma-70 factor (ECF subfamily)
MDDETIISMYWDRNGQAVGETEKKYGRYCFSIARNILDITADAEECVNDTWLRAWNSMPPHRPPVLSVFLGKITRNLAFDRYRHMHRIRRTVTAEVLEELKECVSDTPGPEDNMHEQQLRQDIASFVSSLPEEKRMMFVRRYWYCESVRDIAVRMSRTQSSVSVTLHRLREQLKEELIRKGYDL